MAVYNVDSIRLSNVLVESRLATGCTDQLQIAPPGDSDGGNHAAYFVQQCNTVVGQMHADVGGKPLPVSVTYVTTNTKKSAGVKRSATTWEIGHSINMFRMGLGDGHPVAIVYTKTSLVRILGAKSVTDARAYLPIYMGVLEDVHNRSSRGVFQGCGPLGGENSLKLDKPDGDVSNIVGACRPSGQNSKLRVKLVTLFQLISNYVPELPIKKASADYEPDQPGKSNYVKCKVTFKADELPEGSNDRTVTLKVFSTGTIVAMGAKFEYVIKEALRAIAPLAERSFVQLSASKARRPSKRKEHHFSCADLHRMFESGDRVRLAPPSAKRTKVEKIGNSKDYAAHAPPPPLGAMVEDCNGDRAGDLTGDWLAGWNGDWLAGWNGDWKRAPAVHANVGALEGF